MATRYKLPQSERVQNEERRILGLLQMRNTNGEDKFAKGLTAQEIAQNLVGINSGRTPSVKYIQFIDSILSKLESEGKLESIQE